MAQIDGAQIVAGDLHESGELAADALEKARDGRLAGAAAADDAEHRAGRYLEADAVEGGSLGAGIGEAHVIEADGAGDARTQPVRAGVALERPVEHRRGFPDRSA